MSELQIITNDNTYRKKKNTKFWIATGIILNVLMVAFLIVLVESDTLGIAVLSIAIWVLIILILALTNNKISNGEA